MAIQDILNKLLSEPFMMNMRQHMVDGLNQVYKDATEKGDTNMEVLRARGSSNSLNDRLDEFDEKQLSTSNVLAQKASINYVDAILMDIAKGGPNSGPQGPFMSLTALYSHDFPDGKEGTWLVFDTSFGDGAHSFMWDSTNSAWKDLGVYQATGIADASIPKEKLAFLTVDGEQSTNLFDKTDVKNGYYIDSVTGAELEAVAEPKSNYNASGWIRVKDINKITIRYVNQYHFYNANKQPISGGTNTNKAEILIVPPTADLFRTTVLTQYLNKQQINTGEVLLDYETHENKIKNTQLKKNSLSEDRLAFPAMIGKKSTNLFDKKKVVGSRYIAWNTGKETVPSVEPKTNYNASERINVFGQTQITVKFLGQAAFYDVEDTYISGVSKNNTTETLNIPVGARIFRATVMKDHLDTQQIVFGATLGEYENAGNLMSGDQIEKKTITIDKLAFDLDNSKLKKPYQLFSDFILNRKTRIKLIGDSITHGTGGTGFAENGEQIANTTNLTSPNSYSWANSFRKTVKKIDANIEVINWAISGKTSAYYKENIAQFITADDDLVIMQLGTNDRINCQNWQESSANLKSIVDYARSLNVPIILMSANPVSVTNDNNISDYNFNMFGVNLAVKQAAYHAGVEHISNYDAFFKYKEYTGASMDSLREDNIHPNDDGYDVMFRNIVRELGISYITDGITS